LRRSARLFSIGATFHASIRHYREDVDGQETREQSLFGRECASRGWGTNAAFLAVFERTARELGESVELTVRQLQRWRKPEPPRPRRAAWRVLHFMFGIDPTDLGFPAPPRGAKGYSTPRGAIDRRVVLGSAVGAAAGVIGTTFAADNAVGTAHLMELREGLRSLFSLDDAYGSADVRPLAVRHLARVRRVINTGTYSDSVGRQLHLLAGEVAEHCGWLAYDADEQNDASRLWGDALTSATMLQDDGLQILVMASMSLQAIHVGRPRDGLELARSARRRAALLGASRLEGVLAVREARALASAQDASSAKRALADAMRLTERADRGRAAPSPAWADFHGQAELDFATGMTYADLGHYRAAIPYLQAALKHQESRFGRNRALYRLTMARTMIQAGAADGGAEEAVGSLAHLAEVQSGRVVKRLTEVRNHLHAVGSTALRGAVETITHHLEQGTA
jgi:hypothetical protein